MSRACCPMTSFGRSPAATHLREHGGRGARGGVGERRGGREAGWARGGVRERWGGREVGAREVGWAPGEGRQPAGWPADVGYAGKRDRRVEGEVPTARVPARAGGAKADRFGPRRT